MKVKGKKTEDKLASTAQRKLPPKFKVRGKRNAKSRSGPIVETKRNDLCPILEVEQIPIVQISCPERNVRRAETAQIARVVKSVEKFGFVKPILVNSEYVVIDGNVQLEAARQIGLETAPCIRVDHLSDTELRQLRATLNKLQESQPVPCLLGAWELFDLHYGIFSLRKF